MAEHKQFPAWIQNALGVALGTAVLGIAFAAWDDRALDARRDERLNHLEVGFTEFRKPGKRYAQVDADRDRLDVQRQTAVIRENLRELNDRWITTTVKINKVAAKLEALQHVVYPRSAGYPGMGMGTTVKRSD